MGLFKRNKDKAAAPQQEWPKINELLWVRLPCCESAIHPSRVEDVNGETLALAQPSKPHLEPVPPPTRPFVIGWRSGSVSKQAKVELLGTADGEVPTWTVTAIATPEEVQRRRYVRVAWDREIVFYLPGVSGTSTGKLLDVSEGGLRASLPKTGEPRGEFEVSFDLDGKPLVSRVTVAWWGTSPTSFIEVGLEFVDQDPAMAKRLRAHAYELQVEQRKSSGNKNG